MKVKVGKRIDPKLFDFFTRKYLHESRPSLRIAWEHTLFYAIHDTSDKIAEQIITGFPSVATFYRQLRKAFDESTVFRARYGESACNCKFATPYRNKRPGY